MVLVEKEGNCGCCDLTGIFCKRKNEKLIEDAGAMDASSFLKSSQEVSFSQTLSSPLEVGSHIIITGTPNEDSPWPAINIGTGDPDDDRSDICVHFNTRIPQKYVVRNTRKNGLWGLEETTAFRPFPFEIDKPFMIEVVMDSGHTLWAVDGNYYCSYAHRVPSPGAANWVQITGVRNAEITIDKTDTFPKFGPPLSEVPDIPRLGATPHSEEPKWQPNTVAFLPNGLPEGHQVVIEGRLRPILHSFHIELADGAQEWPHPNVLVHVNPRALIEPHHTRQLVVFNTWLDGWGEERRQRTARFIPGSDVTIRLVRSSKEWLVYADNVLLGELDHRADADKVRVFRLRGDLHPKRIYTAPTD